MINTETMMKPQKDLFDFLENIIQKKYNDLILECFLKFKNKTIFEITMKRILKGKDEFDCDEYKITLIQVKYIVDELQKLKKNNKKIKKVESKKVVSKKVESNKTEKLNKEDCEKWEQNKKNIKNGKIINIKNGKKINYTTKNGDLTKKVNDINKECGEVQSEKKSIKVLAPLPKKIPLIPQLPKTPKSIKSNKKIYNSFDQDECKVQDDCDSKCCKNNQCVSSSICKKEQKEKEKDDNMKKQIEKNNKAEKKLRIDYNSFEKKIISLIKDLTGKLGRKNIDKIISDKEKIEEKTLNVYNEKFAGTTQAFIINKIPFEIQRHLNFLNESIKKLTPRSKKSKTPKSQVIEEIQTFSDEEIEDSKEETLNKLSKNKSLDKKIKIDKKYQKKILDDLKENKLNKDDMDLILKKLNLKTHKEYLKELILIGLNKI